MQYPVALVFGRERTGLTNDELQKGHYHVGIPAMAVQTLCYEVRMRWL